MYKVYVCDKDLNDYHNIIEFTFDNFEEATKFIEVIINHSEDYTIEINKIKGE